MEIVCGTRAMKTLSAAYEQARAIGQRLSVKPLETAAAADRVEAELSAAKLRQAELEESLFAYIAREYTGTGNVLLFYPPLRPDGARKLADAVGKTCGGLAAVFAGEAGSYHYALVQNSGTDISSLVKAMNTALHGRGGGRNGFAQGSLQASEAEIRVFWESQIL